MTTDTPAIVDALPYVDTAIDDDEEQRSLAMRAVDDELDTFPPSKDYIEYLPSLAKRPFCSPAIEYEHSCIEKNQPRPDSTELSNINVGVPPPSSTSMDNEELAIWLKCLNQIKIKLEYQSRQMVNLDILKTYGAAAWHEYIERQTWIEASLKNEIALLNKQIQEVNWLRKNDQERVFKTLKLLNNEWCSLADTNHVLTKELQRMSMQI